MNDEVGGNRLKNRNIIAQRKMDKFECQWAKRQTRDAIAQAIFATAIVSFLFVGTLLGAIKITEFIRGGF